MFSLSLLMKYSGTVVLVPISFISNKYDLYLFVFVYIYYKCVSTYCILLLFALALLSILYSEHHTLYTCARLHCLPMLQVIQYSILFLYMMLRTIILFMHSLYNTTCFLIYCRYALPSPLYIIIYYQYSMIHHGSPT